MITRTKIAFSAAIALGMAFVGPAMAKPHSGAGSMSRISAPMSDYYGPYYSPVRDGYFHARMANPNETYIYIQDRGNSESNGCPCSPIDPQVWAASQSRWRNWNR